MSKHRPGKTVLLSARSKVRQPNGGLKVGKRAYRSMGFWSASVAMPGYESLTKFGGFNGDEGRMDESSHPILSFRGWNITLCMGIPGDVEYI